MGTDKNIKLHIVTDIKSSTRSCRDDYLQRCFHKGRVFTDAYKVELVDDLYYKVHGKYIVEDSSISDDLIGGNKSAEAEDGGGGEDNMCLIPDVVSSNKLEQAPSIVSKNDYKDAIKTFIAKLVNHVGEEDKDRAAYLKENLNLPMLKKFKELRIYACSGDGFDLEGGLIHS